MTLHVVDKYRSSICHEELRARFLEMRVPAGDDDALLDASSLLHDLGRNRSFLTDVVKDKLKKCLDGQFSSRASAQTLSICDLGDGHYLRMSFWPSKDEPVSNLSDERVFYYGVPHDHNFSFATIGYAGPGYESDFYEILEETNLWQPESPVNLRYVGREILSPGTCVMYRRHIDVHCQLAPSKTSISINLMAPATAGTRENQFVFDAECSRVTHLMQARFNPIIFSLARFAQADAVNDMLDGLLYRHPDTLVQAYAFKALTAGQSALPDKERYLERGTEHPNGMVRSLAVKQMSELA